MIFLDLFETSKIFGGGSDRLGGFSETIVEFLRPLVRFHGGFWGVFGTNFHTGLQLNQR